MGAFDDLIPQKAGRSLTSFPQRSRKRKSLSAIGLLTRSALTGTFAVLPLAGHAGAADLGVGGASVGCKRCWYGDGINKRISEKEKEYQDARTAAGGKGSTLHAWQGMWP